MKKILAMILVLAMVLAACPVCFADAAQDWYDYVAGKEDPQLVDMDETLELTYLGWNYNGVLPKNDSIMAQIIEKRFNVKIDNVQVDNYNKEQWNLALSTGVPFDVYGTGANFAKLADEGLIRPVPVEMIETYAPTITAALVAALGENWYEYSSYDGECWGIPTYSASWETPQIMGLRADWLRNIGYDASNLPTTMEGLEEMLLKLHTDDPDQNGKDDTYALGMSNSFGFYEYAAYGIAKGYWYYNADGELMTAAADPNLKDALKLIRRWVELGIYDPEIITDKRADGVAKYVNGVIAGYESLDNCFQVYGGASLSGPGAIYADTGEEVPCLIIPPMEGLSTVMYAVPANSNGIAYGVDTSDEKVIRALQIVDTYYSDLELWLTDNRGAKGVHWDYDENGNVIYGTVNGFEDWALLQSSGAAGEQRYYNFQFIPQSVLAYRLGGVGQENSRYEIWNAVKDFPKIPAAAASSFTTEAETEYSVSANKVYDEYLLKAISGEVDIDATFDAFQQEWLASGGQQILDAKRAL